MLGNNCQEIVRLLTFVGKPRSLVFLCFPPFFRKASFSAYKNSSKVDTGTKQNKKKASPRSPLPTDIDNLLWLIRICGLRLQCRTVICASPCYKVGVATYFGNTLHFWQQQAHLGCIVCVATILISLACFLYGRVHGSFQRILVWNVIFYKG